MIASGNYGSNFNFTLSSSRLLSQFVPNINIIRWAVRAFFKYGGHPQILRSLPYHSGTTPISDFSSPHPVQYSSSHNGFALYLSRLIRPVWNENVTVRRKERKNNEREVDVQYCKFLPEQLNVIQEMLSNLYKFIHESKNFFNYVLFCLSF